MALSDKDILITPNRGQTADPKIEFKGADVSTAAQTISLNVYPTNNGTVSFEGSAGQLFSITNSLSGTIYSVNDVSGIPSIEVLDTGLVKIAQYSGNILLGTGIDNGTDKLQVNGAVTATDFNSTSDIRFKKDIERIDSALEKVQKLSGYTFTLLDDNKRSTGVIAQEVEQVLPEAVGGNSDKKTVAYGNMTGLLIEAIKEQQKQIESLIVEVNNLKA